MMGAAGWARDSRRRRPGWVGRGSRGGVASPPCALLMLEAASALAMVSVCLVLVASLTVAMVQTQRQQQQRTTALLAAANVLERVDLWVSDARLDARLETLVLPEWARAELPEGRMQVVRRPDALNLAGAGPLDAIEVTVTWRSIPRAPASRVRLVSWKPASGSAPAAAGEEAGEEADG